MASLRTEITEITTGLAMLGLGDLDWALSARPEQIVGVSAAEWDRLMAARVAGAHDVDFARAWDNGLAFLRSADALRSRVPARIEWKGPDRLPLVSDVPADLRVDRVYLVSCKYLSKVLHNVAPAGLFDGGLAARLTKAGDWFAAVAPAELQDLYRVSRTELGAVLPSSGPGRSSRALPPAIATMVDSSPIEVGPSSTIKPIRSPRLARTWPALVALIRPLAFAEGAARGRPQAANSACIAGCADMRRAIVGSPAVTSGAMPDLSRCGRTKVSGPGQKRSARLRAIASNSPIVSACASDATWTISGLKLGRPFAW